MLATPWPKAFDDETWWFEVKWDGYRALAYCGPDRTELRSRRGNDVGLRFPEVTTLRLPTNTVLDGEIITFNDEGAPSFYLLGQRPANFVVFDVLFHERDVCGLPLEERRQILESIALPAPAVLSHPVKGDGLALFEAVEARGLEGVLAKRSGSLYYPGRRSPDWRKIVYRQRSRGVVGGYLIGEGERALTFGSLLLGLWSEEGLKYIGSVGSGFDQSGLTTLLKRLRPLERSGSPFCNTVDTPGRKVYVEPIIVVDFEFREWTPYGRIRAPVFKGVSDVPADLVTWEAEGPS
jgi:bifunctional non-homologous end joining protein LigD